MTVPDFFYTGNSPAAVFTMNPFIVDPPICTVTYSCSVISGPRFDLCAIIDGATKGVFNTITGDYAFESTDMANYLPGVYQFEITGTVGAKSDKIVVDIRLVDPCPTTVINLEPSPFVDETYVLRDPTSTQSWDPSNLFTDDSDVDCGSISLDFLNADGTVLDPTIFEDKRDLVTQNTFSVLYSEDVTKAGTYPILYRTYYTNYPANSVQS